MGAFVIFNTLSITVGQRVREFATLRTIGASRRQVRGSVILEALVIGALASVAGLFLGLGLAKGLSAIFAALGADIPQSGIVFAPRTIIVSLLAGILITLAASLVPAMRATEVPPIAAVREGATLPPSRFSASRRSLGLILVAGIALLVYGMVVDDLGTSERLISVGVGCLILFIGVAGLSSLVVKPLARVLGWPAERVAGAAGRLARENSTRNPHRTASTAAALMIGLALITFVAVLAQGLRSSIDDAINQQVSADYVVVSDDNFTPFQPASDEAVAAVPGAEVVGVRGERGRVNGSEKNVTGADPAGSGRSTTSTGSRAPMPRWRRSATAAPLVEKSLAEDKQLELDSLVIVETPNGTSLNARVKGIYEAPAFWEMLGDITISQAAFDEEFDNPRNLYTFITVPGASHRRTSRRSRRRSSPSSREAGHQGGVLRGPAGVPGPRCSTCSTSCLRCP